jgi:hypothetical protein
MDALTAFGLFAVTAMLVCYALEDRSHWFVLAFAGACALGSAYGFLQGGLLDCWRLFGQPSLCKDGRGDLIRVMNCRSALAALWKKSLPCTLGN